MANASKELPAEEPKTIEASDVEQYLEQHPNFLLENPELLTKLNMQFTTGENTVSLIERQIDNLRQQNQKLHTQLNELIETARTNEKLFVQTRKLITQLSATNSKQDIVNILNEKLTSYFNVDACELILFSEQFNNLDNTRCVAETDAREVIEPIIEEQQMICGILRDNERDFLFNNLLNNGAEEIKSAAILPLNFEGKMLGIISLGSFKQDYFKTGSQTDLIDFITDIISERLSK